MADIQLVNRFRAMRRRPAEERAIANAMSGDESLPVAGSWMVLIAVFLTSVDSDTIVVVVSSMVVVVAMAVVVVVNGAKVVLVVVLLVVVVRPTPVVSPVTSVGMM